PDGSLISFETSDLCGNPLEVLLKLRLVLKELFCLSADGFFRGAARRVIGYLDVLEKEFIGLEGHTVFHVFGNLPDSTLRVCFLFGGELFTDFSNVIDEPRTAQ